MTAIVDFSSVNGFFDWIFNSFNVDLFGSVTITVLLLLFITFSILMFFNANKFTVFGFMCSLLMGFGFYGYSIVGWIAPLGAMLAGLLLGLAFIRIFGL